MKKAFLLAFILLVSQLASAQSGPITQTEYVKLLYALEKNPSTKQDLIDALRKRGIGFVLTDGIRSLTRTKGANDEELKRTLEEAGRRRQDPEAAKPPSEQEAAEVLEKARKATQAALDDMPDFVVKQLIARSADRLVQRDQLGAIGEGRLDLHLVDHLGDSFHHVVAGQHPASGIHQIDHGPPVASRFVDPRCEDGDGLGVVELQPSPPTLLGHLRRHVHEQSFLLVR